jgi:radical SAM superfamily enzyme YgiQ (UPF0313 family)
MFGFDEDDVGIFRRTAAFLDEACVDVATVSMVVPMPGTPTFRQLNADGRILTTDWSRYDGKRHCVFEPALMSPRELEAGTEWVARRFYSARSILRRLAGSRAGVWWNLPRNVGYMLAGLWNSGPSWDPAGSSAWQPRVRQSVRGPRIVAEPQPPAVQQTITE